MNRKYLIQLILVAAVLGCKPSQVAHQTSGYEENLSAHRQDLVLEPAVPSDSVVVLPPTTPPEGHIGEELDSVISIIVQRNQEKRVWDGFTIQIYSGLSREQAYKSKETLQDVKPDLEARINYFQPSYRVKCGAYLDQLEAHRVHQELLEYFPNALLLPEKIPLVQSEEND